MADGKDRAGEVLQRVLQHLAAVHVEVVGRLVQQKQVVLAKHQLGQRHAPPLAAGKAPDGVKHIVPREEEQAQRAAHLALLHGGKAVPDLVQHGVGRVEVLLVLVIIPDINIDAVFDAAPVGRELMGQNFEQRALAHAVGADERHAVARAQLEAHVFKHRLAVIGLAQALNLQRLLAAAAARLEAEAHMSLLDGLFQPLQLVQTLLAAFSGLDALFPVEAAVTLNDGLFPLDFLLLQVVGLHAIFKVRGALAHVLGVVAGEFDHAAAENFAHRGADVIQEIPVMADEQQRPLVFRQIALQPFDGLQIEVVGRLVHEDDVGLLQKQFGQRKARPLAAGEGAHLAPVHVGLEAQAA